MIVEIVKTPHGHLVTCECDYCKKIFNRRASNVLKLKNHFCNKDCCIKWFVGENATNYGKHLTEEHKRKIGESKKGNTYNVGHHHTLESILKMSLSKKGKTIGEDNHRFGKHHTEETKEKIRLAQLGEKGNNWKGGITPVSEVLRRCGKYYNWRTLVFERDDYTCQRCNKRGGTLNAHHIKSFTYYPELRYEVSNGITYCEDCHKNNGIHIGMKKLKVLVA